MPDPNQDFIDAVNGNKSPAAAADPNQDFIDAVGGGAPGGTSTPETDRALDETLGSRFLGALKKPSPAWMQPFEGAVRRFATTAPHIPVSPDSSGPMKLMAGTLNPILGMATLENAALGAAWVAQPEIGAALTAAKIAPGVAPWWQQIKRLPQMTPQEGLELGAQTWPMLALPFFHAPVDPFKIQGVTPQFTPEQVHANLASKEQFFNAFDKFKAQGGDPVAEIENLGASLNRNPNWAEMAGHLEKNMVPPAAPVKPAAPEEAAPGLVRESVYRPRITIHGEEVVGPQAEAAKAAAAAPEPQEKALQRATKLRDEYRKYGGEPDAVFHDIADLNDGEPPSYSEYADALQDEIKKVAGSYNTRQEAIAFAEAKKRGVPLETVKAEQAEKAEAAKQATSERLQQESEEMQYLFGGEEPPPTKKGRYASRIRSAAPVSQLEIRPRLGEKAPLQQQRETPRAQEQPVSTGESVATETPEGAHEPRYVTKDTFDPYTKEPKGAVVIDTRSNRRVGIYEGKAAHPNAEELADLRQSATEHAGTLNQEKEGFADEDVYAQAKNNIHEAYDVPDDPEELRKEQMSGRAPNQGELDTLYKVEYNRLQREKEAAPQPEKAEQPKIVAAAIQDAGTGKTFTGPSHPQIYDKFPQIEGDPGEPFTGEGWNTGGNYIDGFVDQNGKFYDRGEAAKLAGLKGEVSMGELEAVAGKIPEGTPYKIVKPPKKGEKLSVEPSAAVSGPEKPPAAESPAAEEPQQAPERFIAPKPAARNRPERFDGPMSTKDFFQREGKGRYRHREKGASGQYLRIVRNEQGDWDVLHPDDGRVVDTFTSQEGGREAAMRHYHQGEPPVEEAPRGSEPEEDFDFSTVEGFEKAVDKMFKRKITPDEKAAFQKISKEVSKLKGDAAEAASQAMGNVLKYFKNVEDIPWHEAVQQIHDALDDAVSGCQ